MNIQSKGHYLSPDQAAKALGLSARSAKSDQEYKADAGKAMPDLFEVGFANAIRLVQATLEYGAKKYKPHSWRHVPNGLERYARAGGRHRQNRNLDAVEQGHESILHSRDAESNLPHIAHEILNLMAMIELALAKEVELSGDTISARQITENLVALMKEPPLDHKQKPEN